MSTWRGLSGRNGLCHPCRVISTAFRDPRQPRFAIGDNAAVRRFETIAKTMRDSRHRPRIGINRNRWLRLMMFPRR